MSNLIEYLGEAGIQEIQADIRDDVETFRGQSEKTKLVLANQNKFEASMYKAASEKLVDCLEMAGAQIELTEHKLETAEEELKKRGELNQEYIDRQAKHQVIITEDRKHAKKLLKEMIDKEKTKRIKKK